jgi:flagellar basal-body rod protein FlgC
MGFFDGYNIATSGMSAQRTRINIVSSNIANAQTTHTKDGGPYKKQNVVFEEILLNKTKNTNEQINNNNNDLKLAKPIVGVGIKDIIKSKEDAILRYEPNHPDANKNGYVAYPNINPVIEMTDLIEAMRSYEANLSAFQTQKNMDNKTIDLLKG